MACCRGDDEKRRAKKMNSDKNATISDKKAPPMKFNRRKIFRQKNVPPVVPVGGLSIIEQVFYKSPPEKPQVILGGALRIVIPPSVKNFNIERTIDLLKVVASQHPRLASYIDPSTMVSVPFGETAEDIPINYRVVEKKNPGVLSTEFHAEINTNFLLDERKGLWRVVLIVPEGTPKDNSKNVADIIDKTPVKEPDADEIEIARKSNDDFDDWDKPPSAQALVAAASAVVDETTLPRRSSTRRRSFRSRLPWKHGRKSSKRILSSDETGNDKDERSFDLIITFHHSLGDGLCIYTFLKALFPQITADMYNLPVLNLKDYPIVEEPIPLLDNLVNPSFFEVLPAAFGMLGEMISKRTRERFKGRTILPLNVYEPKPATLPEMNLKSDTTNTSNLLTPTTALLGANQNHPSYNSLNTSEVAEERVENENSSANLISHTEANGMKSEATENSTVSKYHPPLPVIHNDALYGLRSQYSNTRTRFLTFDSEFVTALRKRCKAEGTTIAGALVVAALAAVRTSFSNLEEYHNRPLPSHQGWVVTNSARHLLPQSRLLDGGDKQSDPSIDVFGGYAGSVSSTLKLVDNQDFWERSRLVRRKIARAFLVSLQRMKLANYCYRRPKVYDWIERNADLESRSRSYSIELANLGAWDYPNACAPADVPESAINANWMRLQNFWGAVNSSFDGVRGFFTIGVVTLGGNMSVAIGYDSRAVHEPDAELFVKTCTQILRKAAESTGKLTIGTSRSLDTIEEGPTFKDDDEKQFSSMELTRK
ncbi:hypothetical protein HK098_006768 [Nowakowskiella sp. JEL0407]|nr:hypothetical protein HK098_006768 [Nowakowskiella sp. JEL0407]